MQHNIGIGYDGAQGITTGQGNTGIGRECFTSLTTGSYNVAIGFAADVASASTHNGIAIGTGNNNGSAAIASSNQLTVAGVENIYLPGMNNTLGYALIDTSGTGNFVPQSVPNTTPIIDTVTGTSSQTFTLSNNQTNYITGSTTIAGATLAFPAVQSGTIIVIWGVQTTTTTVSGTNTGTTAIPSTVAAGTSRTFVNINGNWK